MINRKTGIDKSWIFHFTSSASASEVALDVFTPTPGNRYIENK